MKSKLCTIVFPHEIQYTSARGLGEEYTDAVNYRYKKKGFGLSIVHPKGRSLECASLPKRFFNMVDDVVEVDTDEGYGWKMQVLRRGKTREQYLEVFDTLEVTDFAKAADLLNPQKYSENIVAGFKVFDCVRKLAKQMHVYNKSTKIDIELTNMFPYYFTSFKEDYDPIDAYEKLLSKLEHPSDSLSQDPLTALLAYKSFQEPYFGVSKARSV